MIKINTAGAETGKGAVANLKPYYDSPEGQIYHGNVLDILKEMAPESVQVVCTSPPYWGL